MKIKSVVKWQNDMVMVFGEDGKQIPELQGKYEDVKDNILNLADNETTFENGRWKEKLLDSVSKDNW